MVHEAVGLCRRIRCNSSSSADIRLAEAVEASLELATGDPQAAIEALEGAPDVDLGVDMLLASAHSALGQTDEADKILQGALFQGLVLSLNRLAQMAALYAGNPAKIDIAYRRAQAIIDAGVEDYTQRVGKAVDGYDPADADIVLTALAAIRDRVVAGKGGSGKPDGKKTKKAATQTEES